MGVIVDGRRTRPVAFDMVMSDDNNVGHLLFCGVWMGCGLGMVDRAPKIFSTNIQR